MSTLYNADMRENTTCIEHNLNLIKEKFGLVLRLSVAEMAELLSSSPNNVVQMKRRGHFPFNTVSVGSRVFFPVHSVAQWLCGEFECQEERLAISVQLPKRTPRKAKMIQTWRDAVLAFNIEIERRMRLILAKDDKSKLSTAALEHEASGVEVVNEVERLWLLQRVWLQGHTETEAL